jgi:molybdate transport system substrate-binding protein
MVRDLTRPEIKLVIAAPDVPVGSYTLAFLEKAGGDLDDDQFKEEVLQNVVSYENDVKAVAAKVALGEADAGIVYASDVSGEVSGNLILLEIPETWNIEAAYPIAPTSQSGNPQLASKFIDFVRSPQGQTVLVGAGFQRVRDEPLQP